MGHSFVPVNGSRQVNIHIVRVNFVFCWRLNRFEHGVKVDTYALENIADCTCN